MPATKTLAQLRTTVRFEGDFENSRIISDARLDDTINKAAREVWDFYADFRPDLLVIVQAGAPVTAPGVPIVALAPNFYRLRQVEIFEGDRSHRLHEVNLSEAWRYQSGPAVSWSLRYRVQNNNLYFHPTPTTANGLAIFYIPTLTPLVATTDTFDGINGFEDLLVCRAVLSLLRREKMPTQEFETEAERLEKRIRDGAEQLNTGEPFYLSGTGPRVGSNPDYWLAP